MQKNNKIINLDKYQSNFVNSKLQNCKLYGLPGGGKTTILVEKIKYLINFDKFSIDNILVLTFSKRTREDFINKANDKNICNTNNVHTFHSFARKIIVSEGFKPYVNNMSLWILRAKNILESSYDDNVTILYKNLNVILVDEAQDMCKSDYDFIKTIQKKSKCFLILVGDPNQNIFQFRNSKNDFLINEKCKCFNLKYNYRSTKQVINLLNKVKPINNSNLMKTKNSSYYKSPELYYGEEKYLKLKLIEELKSTKFQYEDIAIISSVKKNKCDEKTGLSISLGLNQIQDLLEDNNIKFCALYDIYTDIGSKIIKTKFKPKKGHVNLLTIHCSKGLEFKKVILLNYQHKTQSTIPTENETNIFKYWWYVGFSRVQQELTLYVLNHSYLFKDFNKIKTFFTIYTQNSKLKIYTKSNIHYDKKREFKNKNYSVTKYLENIDANSKQKLLELFHFNSCKNLMLYENTLSYKKFLFFKYQKKLLEKNLWEQINWKFIDTKYNFLYGIYFEKIFVNLYLQKSNNKYDNYYKNEINKWNNAIFIDRKWLSGLSNIFLNLCGTNKPLLFCINWNKLLEIYNHLSTAGKNLTNYLKIIISNKKIEDDFYVIVESNIKFPLKIIKNLYIKILNKESTLYEDIFQIIKLRESYNYEMKSLLNFNFDSFLEIAKKHINKNLKPFIQTLESFNFNFNKSINFSWKKLLNFTGEMDIIDKENKILIDLKFSDSVDQNETYFLQIMMYLIMSNLENDANYKLYLFDIKNGTEHLINFNLNDQIKKDFLLILLNSTKNKLNEPILIFDFETDDWNATICKPTEICIRECNLNINLINTLINSEPKTSNEWLTGIKMEEIKIAPKLNIIKKEINNLFKKIKNPIMIAHNVHFDKTIFNNYFYQPNNNITFLDSAKVLRQFNSKSEKKWSLKHYVKKYKLKNKNNHRASDDCKVIIELFNELNINIIDIKNFLF